jgi:signal transduction histidine kinase
LNILTLDARHASADQRILIEQIRIVYDMLGRSSVFTLVLSAFVALVMREHGPIIWGWFAFQVALKLAEMIEVRWFYDPAKVEAAPQTMLHRLYVTQSLHAAGWASVLAIAGQNVSAPELVFVVMALGGVLSGGVTTYGALPRVHAVYIGTFIGVSLVTALFLIVTIPDQPAFYLMPVLGMIYCVGTYMNTRVSGEVYYTHISLSLANAELAEGLARQVDLAEAARREAEAANRAKSTFLASASHDLRQPIHATGLFLSLLRKTRLTSDQQAMAGNAADALNASSQMLDALLDFSRVEAGVVVPQPQNFAFDDLVRQLETELGPLADEKQIVFRVHESGLHVHADQALVRIILLNLMSNAIRYTASGGVLVGARRRGDRLVAEVWDTGIGIAPDKLELIFEEFAQIGNPERDRIKGLGLGLAIARRMARLMGSDIDVISQFDRGSVFRFAVPLATASASPPSPARMTPVPDDVAVHGARVIVLDDDAAIRQGLHALLAQAGYDVATAETVEQAVASARVRHPDMLICDYRLRQGRDGTEAVRLIREQAGRHIPALMITGDTHPDRIAAAEREDMHILYKPVDAERILDTLMMVLTH